MKVCNILYVAWLQKTMQPIQHKDIFAIQIQTQENLFVKISFWKTSIRCHICNTNIYVELNFLPNAYALEIMKIVTPKHILSKQFELLSKVYATLGTFSRKFYFSFIQWGTACTKYCRDPHCNISCRHHYRINWWHLVEWKFKIGISSIAAVCKNSSTFICWWRTSTKFLPSILKRETLKMMDWGSDVLL